MYMSDACARVVGSNLGAKIGLFLSQAPVDIDDLSGSNSALIDQKYDITWQLLKINLPPDDIMAVETFWVWYQRVLD